MPTGVYPRRSKPVAVRFWSRVDKNGPICIHHKLGDLGPCWIWASSKDGVFMVDGKNVRAYRYSWQLHNGDIPDGLCVCHHCDHGVRNEFLCVNPAHLFLGSNADNTRDMMDKNRGVSSEVRSRAMKEVQASRSPAERSEIAKRILAARRANYGPSGGAYSGERHPQAKLVRAQVDEIRRLYATGEWTYKALGEMFGVSHAAIGYIVRGKHWKEPA